MKNENKRHTPCIVVLLKIPVKIIEFLLYLIGTITFFPVYLFPMVFKVR